MKSNKLQKQMKEVLTLSNTGKENAFSILFTEKGALENGACDETVQTDLALFYSSQGGKQVFTGHVYNKEISDINKKITIAFDLRKEENSIMFLSIDDYLVKINSKSFLLPEEKIVIYWEYGNYTFLSLTFYDPIEEKTIIECIFNHRLDRKVFSRHLLSGLLPERDSLHLKNILMESVLIDEKNNEVVSYE